ncbi:MAG: adenine phosphoribosyltransferase [Spirochaetota bacterium]|nr:adenine phosphoribosyltransferase [Spirochaetota bacterium]
MDREGLKKIIRDIPDFPKEGIIFKDITTLLNDAAALRSSIILLTEECKKYSVSKVVGIESRGFILGVPIALELNAGFVPIRKPGKLPADTISETYDLEYGTDSIEMHRDAINPGEKVIIIDDLLATGGTAKAASTLVEKIGGEVELIIFMIELTFLKGREKLGGRNLFSLIEY